MKQPRDTLWLCHANRRFSPMRLLAEATWMTAIAKAKDNTPYFLSGFTRMILVDLIANVQRYCDGTDSGTWTRWI